MEETPQAGKVQMDETSQVAEAQMDEATQAAEGLTDEETQAAEIPMDEASHTAAGRFSLRDAAPFALVVLVTVAVIAFIVAAPSAHAETSTAQGNDYIQQTVEYTPGEADLLPAVYDEKFSSATECAEVHTWGSGSVKNAVDYKVSVESDFGQDAYFRTVIALECGPNGDALTFLNANTAAFSWTKVSDVIKVKGVDYVVYVAVYEGIVDEEAGTLADGKFANGSSVDVVTQVAMKSSVVSSDVATLGNGYSIMVVTQAVQAEGFEAVTDDQGNVTKSAAAAALDTAFGEITVSSHPWSGSKDSDSSTAA